MARPIIFYYPETWRFAIKKEQTYELDHLVAGYVFFRVGGIRFNVRLHICL
jgi:hypothetical protein